MKVQFHWDRYGKRDENSSCWVRVSQPWAGKNWGMMALPRIGQEVVVDFLEGDPDQPLITGSVYNHGQMPPYALPANKTQSGIKSRSTKGGQPAHFNEFRFEDKKGEEQVYIHAEKNQDNVVEHNKTLHVGNNRTETVDGNETLSIGGSRSKTIGHDETSHVKHDRTATVNGNETLTVHDSQTTIVDQAISITTNQANVSIKAATEIRLQVGGSSIVMTPGDITLISPKININP